MNPRWVVGSLLLSALFLFNVALVDGVPTARAADHLEIVAVDGAPLQAGEQYDALPPAIFNETVSMELTLGGGTAPYSLRISDDPLIPDDGDLPAYVYLKDVSFPGDDPVWEITGWAVETRGDFGPFIVTIEITDALGDVAYHTLEWLIRNPVADAGDDVEVDSTSSVGASVTLDGTGSWDPMVALGYDNDLAYLWTASGITFDDATSDEPTATFPIGTTVVTLQYTSSFTDQNGSTIVRGIDTDQVVVVVVLSDEAPEAVCTTDRASLWPPNHKVVTVNILLEVDDDNTDPEDLDVSCTVESSEPDDGSGDGKTTGDVDGEDGYSDPVVVSLTWSSSRDAYVGTVDLRAERDGSDGGRTYSIVCTVEDEAENETTATCVVVVPHSKGG